MTATGTLITKYRLSTNKKLKQKSIKRQRHQTNSYKPLQTINHRCNNNNNNNNNNNYTMSKALIDELDLKMQQVREYGLIAHGYHNENLQYPVHVRRSHDGEKVGRRPTPRHSKSDSFNNKTLFLNSTILTPSSHENRTKTKQKDSATRQLSYDERHTTLNIPPNKTVNDINPSLNCDRYHTHRKSSLSSINSSPILCSTRPHSIAGITHEQQINSLSNSSQSLINQPLPIKTLTQRFFSKLFHHPSKS